MLRDTSQPEHVITQPGGLRESDDHQGAAWRREVCEASETG